MLLQEDAYLVRNHKWYELGVEASVLANVELTMNL